jgi:cyclic-di-GMP phosphodiesterase TipF (flagellum assembly factor)
MGKAANPRRIRAAVQSLVYIFILMAGLGVGASAYFGLTFTPIESLVTALAVVAIAIVMLERTLRRRAEARLERAIEDLSRLLSTDAQAGAVLGQRIAALTEIDADARLEAVEADLSVLGTVVREVAEAVADLEEARKRQNRKESAGVRRVGPAAAPLPARPELEAVAPLPSPEPSRDAPPPIAEIPVASPPATAAPAEPGPVIPLETLRQALDDNRLVFHLLPIVTLPQRKAAGYDLVPRLMLEEGEFADPPDFLPKQGGESIIRRIERLALEEAVTMARRARTIGQPATFYVPISPATLLDAAAIEKAGVLLEANRVVAPSIMLLVMDSDWAAMAMNQRAALAAFVGRGLALSLVGVRSLRLDFAALAGEGVRSVRFDAHRFIEEPETLTDFHTSDVAAYLRRYGVDAIATAVHTEDQTLTLLEDGIGFAQGPHVGALGPARADLVVGRPAAVASVPSRAEA